MITKEEIITRLIHERGVFMTQINKTPDLVVLCPLLYEIMGCNPDGGNKVLGMSVEKSQILDDYQAIICVAPKVNFEYQEDLISVSGFEKVPFIEIKNPWSL